MSSSVLKDQKIWFDGYDMTGIMNAIALEYGVDAKDGTVFGNDTHINKGGLKTVAASCEGFFDASPYDAALKNLVGAEGKVLSFGVAATEGSPAYSFKAMAGSYKPGGSIGDMFGFSLEAATQGPLIRGTIAANKTAITATANAAAQQLGAVAAGKKLYAALHVLNVAGMTPTIDVIIQSDDSIGFASAVTALTFDQMIAAGSQWKEVAGTMTDDWYRVRFTIGGTTPTFDFVVIFAII